MCLDISMDDTASVRPNAPEIRFEVRNSKVEVVRIWLRIPRVAVRSRIEARENHAAATEVVAARRNPAARITKNVAMERGSGLDVRNRNDHSK